MPDNITRIGDTTAQPIGTEREFDPVTGVRTTEIWEGEEDDLNTQAELFRAQGYKAHVFPYNGPVFRMRVSIPDSNSGGETPTYDTWERVTEAAQEDIRSNPKLIALAGEAWTLNYWYNDARKKIKDQLTATSFSYADDNRQAFFELLSRGAEAHELRRTILKRKRVLHINLLAQSEVSATEKFYSTSALISNFAVPVKIANKLPVAGDTTPAHTAWGWKERSDTSVVTPALYKVEEVKEFVFAAWSTLLYDYVS